MARRRADILRDLRRLADEVARIDDTRVGRQVDHLISGVQHMREPLPDDFDPIEVARQKGALEQEMLGLRQQACRDPELMEAVRAKAWLRAGLPKGAVVHPDGTSWIKGLPYGWPEGVDADAEVERYVSRVLDSDES